MNTAGQPPSPAPSSPPSAAPPRAKLRQPRFQLVWLIPLLAAAIAGYLGYRTFMEQGPLLTLTFNSADGLQTGQTQLKYKAVALGTVESIDLSPDSSHVVVRVRMTEVGARFLTSHARFWVERPRFDLSDTAGIETIVSGPYIAVDPGAPGGNYQSGFTGLEQPPGVRSDEPGRTYTLIAADIGALKSGSPVFYRGAVAGEVLGYDFGGGLGPVKVSIFVSAPFDDLVRPDSRFWDTSGVALGVEGGVLQVQVQSLQAVLAGGVSFALPDSAQNEAASPSGTSFPLYASKEAADAAAYRTQVPFIAYFNSDVSGLTQGAPVTMLGLQVGNVTDVALQVDSATGTARVCVTMAVQPGRVLGAAQNATAGDVQAAAQRLVDHGLRAELGTESYVTGQKQIDLAFLPNAPAAQVTREGSALVLPAQDSGLDIIMANASDISTKLDKVPFQQIGEDLDKLLRTANGTVGGPQVKDTLTQLDQTLSTLNQNYGTDSDTQHQLSQVLSEAQATLQALSALTTELNAHPQSLIFGRSGQ
jgi:paraquat-inducible protein B